MRVQATDLPEIMVLEPQVFGDSRGHFFESHSRRSFNAAIGQAVDFVQDNQSRSSRGVLRGLHYQLAPYAQGKLVRVTAGRIFDVAVDMRRSSPRFGRWAGIELSAEDFRQLWIPPGFAHGFLVLSDSADVLYKATAYYTPSAERAVRWDDPELAIAWPDLGMAPTVSSKDAAATAFAEAVAFD